MQICTIYYFVLVLLLDMCLITLHMQLVMWLRPLYSMYLTCLSWFHFMIIVNNAYNCSQICLVVFVEVNSSLPFQQQKVKLLTLVIQRRIFFICFYKYNFIKICEILIIATNIKKILKENIS